MKRSENKEFESKHYDEEVLREAFTSGDINMAELNFIECLNKFSGDHPSTKSIKIEDVPELKEAIKEIRFDNDFLFTAELMDFGKEIQLAFMPEFIKYNIHLSLWLSGLEEYEDLIENSEVDEDGDRWYNLVDDWMDHINPEEMVEKYSGKIDISFDD